MPYHQVCREKDSVCLFRPSLYMNTVNAALWGSYGFFALDGEIVMVTTNSINVIINVSMILLTFYYPVLCHVPRLATLCIALSRRSHISHL